MSLRPSTRGHSLIGLVVTLGCMALLAAVILPSLRSSITGDGRATPSSAWGMQDQIQIQSIVRAMITDAMAGRDTFIIPSELCDYGREEDNTTASFWSAMVMERLVSPKHLVAPGDRGWVERIERYDYSVYDPREGVCWDSMFSADLDDVSNVSYAHMPLLRERLDRWWHGEAGGTFPIIGSRGPRDGDPAEASFTLDDDGQWRGWVCRSDGSIEWHEHTTIGAHWRRRGGPSTDNLFRIDDVYDDDDAMLGFTSVMDGSSPTFQWD